MGYLPPGGAGGQNVNKVESGVRLRYVWKNPITGVSEEILIECTETRDQPKNKERALTRLRSFIYDKEHQKYLDDIASKRKTMVSTGDRPRRSVLIITRKGVSRITVSITRSIIFQPLWTVKFKIAWIT